MFEIIDLVQIHELEEFDQILTNPTSESKLLETKRR